eukprot:394406-Prymnesium_polylepis.1
MAMAQSSDPRADRLTLQRNRKYVAASAFPSRAERLAREVTSGLPHAAARAENGRLGIVTFARHHEMVKS